MTCVHDVCTLFTQQYQNFFTHQASQVLWYHLTSILVPQNYFHSPYQRYLYYFVREAPFQTDQKFLVTLTFRSPKKKKIELEEKFKKKKRKKRHLSVPPQLQPAKLISQPIEPNQYCQPSKCKTWHSHKNSNNNKIIIYIYFFSLSHFAQNTSTCILLISRH